MHFDFCYNVWFYIFISLIIVFWPSSPEGLSPRALPGGGLLRLCQQHQGRTGLPGKWAFVNSVVVEYINLMLHLVLKWWTGSGHLLMSCTWTRRRVWIKERNPRPPLLKLFVGCPQDELKRVNFYNTKGELVNLVSAFVTAAVIGCHKSCDSWRPIAETKWCEVTEKLIQRPRWRSPPLSPNLGDAGCVYYVIAYAIVGHFAAEKK